MKYFIGQASVGTKRVGWVIVEESLLKAVEFFAFKVANTGLSVERFLVKEIESERVKKFLAMAPFTDTDNINSSTSVRYYGKIIVDSFELNYPIGGIYGKEETEKT